MITSMTFDISIVEVGISIQYEFFRKANKSKKINKTVFYSHQTIDIFDELTNIPDITGTKVVRCESYIYVIQVA